MSDDYSPPPPLPLQSVSPFGPRLRETMMLLDERRRRREEERGDTSPLFCRPRNACVGVCIDLSILLLVVVFFCAIAFLLALWFEDVDGGDV